jgi:hypothetical protein
MGISKKLHGKLVMSVLAGVATVALAVPSAAFAAQGSGGGGGGGEEPTETATNSLAVPVIIVGADPFGLSCGTDVPGAVVEPTGEPTSNETYDNPDAYYYVQGVNTWQAQCMTALTGTATVDWGDNLSGSASLAVGHPIRVEIGLLADNPPAMSGLDVIKLQSSLAEKDAAYGTEAISSDGGYAANWVTPYSEVRVWDSAAQVTVKDPMGSTVPLTTAGELNATGRTVYGFQLTPELAGIYTVTFTPSSNVTTVNNTMSFKVTSSTGSGSTGTVAGAPTNVAALAGDAQVNLSWSAPTSLGTGTLYGYNVFMGTAPGAEDFSASVTPNGVVVPDTSYAVTGLTNGTKYYFVVQTVTSEGVSASSAEVSATPAAPLPTTKTSPTTGTTTLPVSPPAGPSTVVPTPVLPGLPGASVSGSGAGTGTATGAETRGASSANLTLTATPTKSGGMTAVTYKVKVPGARGGTVLIKAGSRLVCTIQLDNQGQGQCTSSRWNGGGAVTATYLRAGTQKALSASVKTASVPASFWLATTNGSVLRFGGAPDYGSLARHRVQVQNIFGLAGAPDGRGYWMVGRDGGVFAFGSAHFYGSLGGKHLAGQIVGMAPAPDGHGYWMIGSDGGVFSFGSAHFYGSLGGKHLAGQIVGMAPASDGYGYWLVGSNGSVSAFGSARSFGSLVGKTLASPIVGMAATSDGHGYWLVGSNGSVSAFGSARSFGSLAGKTLASPIVGMAPTPDDQGYWLVNRDAKVTGFGNATSLGAPQGLTPGNRVVGIALW